jgi:hypothetical protein
MPSGPDNCDRFSDGELANAFDDGRITKESFRHRDHVRLAFLYLKQYEDLAEAALNFRRAFRAFTVAQGVPHLYHETFTWAYLLLIRQRMHGHEFVDSFSFLRENPGLAAHRTGLITRYYDVEEVTRSPSARELFVLPERGSLEEPERVAKKRPEATCRSGSPSAQPGG